MNTELRLEEMLEQGRFEEASEFIGKHIRDPFRRVAILLNLYILTREEQDHRRVKEAIEKVSDPRRKDFLLAMLRTTEKALKGLEPPLIAPEGTC